MRWKKFVSFRKILICSDNQGIMKPIVALFFILLLSSFSDEPKVAPKPLYKAYFACNYTDVVNMEVAKFQQLMAQPLCGKDSNNNVYKVDGFEITYAERGLYQDSTGLPIITTDYSSGECKGDIISPQWQNAFKERAYKGDTVYFDHILIRKPDNSSYSCRTVKIVLK